VTLVALDFDVDDATKPWRGPVDPRATPARTLSVIAAFLPLAGMSLGLDKITMDLIKKADETCLIGSQEDLSPFNELVRDATGERYKITYLKVLKPGLVRILSYLVLNQ
jgi:hypothetical protein